MRQLWDQPGRDIVNGITIFVSDTCNMTQEPTMESILRAIRDAYAGVEMNLTFLPEEMAPLRGRQDGPEGAQIEAPRMKSAKRQ